MMSTDREATGTEPACKGPFAYSTPQLTSMQTRVPRPAVWLGTFGAIPFVLIAITGLFLEGSLREQAFFGLATYGAVILSFLGGVHWGLAIAGFGPTGNDNVSFRRLAFSVTPSLIGWGALLLPRTAGLLVLAGAFAWLLVFDWRASRKAEVPAWYPRLRRPLTVTVVASLILGAFA